MTKKIARSKATLVAKKDESKSIKKSAKAVGKKAAIDKAVADGKEVVHYILILDDSGSMSGKPWNDLKSASKDFITTLKSSKEASSSLISCVIYNSSARTVFSEERP